MWRGADRQMSSWQWAGGRRGDGWWHGLDSGMLAPTFTTIYKSRKLTATFICQSLIRLMIHELPHNL